MPEGLECIVSLTEMIVEGLQTIAFGLEKMLSTRLSIRSRHCPMHLPGSVRLPLEDSHKLANVVHGFAPGERPGAAAIRSPFERVIAHDRDFLDVKIVF